MADMVYHDPSERSLSSTLFNAITSTQTSSSVDMTNYSHTTLFINVSAAGAWSADLEIQVSNSQAGTYVVYRTVNLGSSGNNNMIKSYSVPGAWVKCRVFNLSGSPTITCNAVSTSFPLPSSGKNTYRNASLSNADVSVNSGPCKLYGYFIQNPNNEDAYFQMYDATTTNVTVGTTTPKQSYLVPPNGAISLQLNDPLMDFDTAFTIAATTGVSNGTAPTTALIVNIIWE